MQSHNPVFNNKVFAQERSLGVGESMTVQGTVNKSLFMLFLVLVPASWIWGKVFTSTPMFEGTASASPAASVGGFLIGGAILGFICAMITVFKREWAGITAPLYALCEGFVLGAFSAIIEKIYPGIVIQAVALTFGTLFCLLVAYKSGMIRVSDKLRLGIVAATGAIGLVYLASWILSFFHISLPIFAATPLGIGFSVIVVIVAALNLVLDFDMIEQSASQNMPRYMEWYCAFGLMVTLIWLYMEILNLLMKLRGRNSN